MARCVRKQAAGNGCQYPTLCWTARIKHGLGAQSLDCPLPAGAKIIHSLKAIGQRRFQTLYPCETCSEYSRKDRCIMNASASGLLHRDTQAQRSQLVWKLLLSFLYTLSGSCGSLCDGLRAAFHRNQLVPFENVCNASCVPDNGINMCCRCFSNHTAWAWRQWNRSSQCFCLFFSRKTFDDLLCCLLAHAA